MKSSVEMVEDALRASTRAELLQALGSKKPVLALSDVNRLAQLLRSFDEQRQGLSTAILRTYTTELLKPYLTFESLLQGFDLDLYEAPYGSLLQELQSGSGLMEQKPDVVYFLLRWEDLEPALRMPVMSLSNDERRKLADSVIDNLCAILNAFRQAMQSLLVVSMLPRMSGPELGNYDAMAAESEAAFWTNLKIRLAVKLRELPGVVLDDIDCLINQIGKSHIFDHRLWHTSRYPFTLEGSQALARRMMTYPVLLKKPKVKCIVLDADNTLWGGIIGEDGIDGIKLGPEYPGSVYAAFQRRLLDFQERGVILAMCSKNNAEDVLEVLRERPHQILKEHHFAARRINWRPKPANIRDIAQELNLGLESFLFVDDSPHECLSVMRELPEVTVIRVPENVIDLPFCLDEVAALETLGFTEEDRQRTDMYAQERQRRELAETSGSLEDYLKSLGMVMTVGFDDSRHVQRIAQLTQKTNQFNLTTRRYTEPDIQRYIDDPNRLVAHFSLMDIFGDSGIVGVALIDGLETAVAEIDTFLMSCRVIGREAETAFLNTLLELLQDHGVRRVKASYIPTQKNGMVKDFWPRQHFSQEAEGHFSLDLSQWSAADDLPIIIKAQNPAIEMLCA